MRDDHFAKLTYELQDIPDGLTIFRHPSCNFDPCLCDFSEKNSKGKRKLDIFAPFPGMRLAMLQLLADSSTIYLHTKTPALILCHCQYGGSDWQDKRENISGSLRSDELFVTLVNDSLDMKITYSKGYFSGIIIYIALAKIADSGSDLLAEANVTAPLLIEKLSLCQNPLILHNSQKLGGLFSILYHLPEPIRLPYYKLKLQELLLFLSIQEEMSRKIPLLRPSQADLIKEIHDTLTANLDQKYTIEELSRQYLINTSSLKAGFKAVYGLPIAAYMKEYRIKQAMKLLLETKESIASIASMVGYRSQSKFTKAFKEITQSLPSEFRKQNHL